jgi:hypothetical protein
MSSSDPADDAPETPQTAPSSHDTERDLKKHAPRESDAPSTDPSEDLSKTLGENTLLSVKAAAARLSDRPDHRVEDLERRLSQLEARLKVLELERGARAAVDKRWMFWAGLLLALALGWQLRAFFR